MNNYDNYKITINKTEDNIIFNSDLMHEESNENISFNMNSLTELFKEITLIRGVETKIRFNENNEKFILTFDGFEEVIELSTNKMLQLLYDAYFNNKPINLDKDIKETITNMSQKESFACLIRNEKPDKPLFFDCRIDIYNDRNEFIATGKYAALDLSDGEGNDLLVATGIVGGNEMKPYNMDDDNADNYKAIIYQGGFKITIEGLVVAIIDTILDIKHIEFLTGIYEVTTERIVKDECLKLNQNNLVCNLVDSYGRVAEASDIIRDLEQHNNLDALVEYSTENKKLLHQSEEKISFIDDDFFDSLF